MKQSKDPNISFQGFPIFAIIKHRGKVIISGGAGAKNVGIKDRLLIYDTKYPLVDPLYDIQAECLFEILASNEKRDLLAASSNEKVFIFKIQPDFELIKVAEMLVDKNIADSRVNLGFSPTGKYLACGSADKFLRTYLLYNNEDGKSIQPELEFEQELDDEVNFTIFSPEGDLVTALTNKSVNVFRRRKKELLYRFETSGIVPKRATFCFFDPSQRYLYTIHSQRRGDSYLSKWDLLKHEEPRFNKIGPDAATGMVISPKFEILGMVDNNGNISAIEIESMKPFYTKKFHSLPPQGCIFGEDGKTIYSVGVDYRVCRALPKKSMAHLYSISVLLVLLIAYLIQNFLY